MSMKWKLRKDKVQDDKAQAEMPADPSDAPPPADAPPTDSVFDLSGAAFAPAEAVPPAASDDPRFEVDENALSFLTAPDTSAFVNDEPETTFVTAEMEHADAGPEGVILPATEEANDEDPLSAFAPYRPAAPSEQPDPVTEFAALDAHPAAFEEAPASAPEGTHHLASPFPPETGGLGESTPASLPLREGLGVGFSPDRESVASGLVSDGDFGLPRVAPFVIDLPPDALPPVSDGPHRLVLRLGNLSAAYDLNRPVTTIGRPDSATQNYPDIEIELDDGVSRRHAEVRSQGGRFSLVDVGSTNGTILNGEMLAPQQPALLAHGDRIRVGERTEIVFE